jgi:hypothetical protein
MRYETTKSEVLADIGIAVLAVVFLFTCWGERGWLFNAGLVWAGANIGYLVTVYMNEGEDDGQD